MLKLVAMRAGKPADGIAVVADPGSVVVEVVGAFAVVVAVVVVLVACAVEGGHSLRTDEGASIGRRPSAVVAAEPGTWHNGADRRGSFRGLDMPSYQRSP